MDDPAAFRDHFSDRPRDYAAHRPGYPAALVDWLASLPARRDLALDAGCGSGQLSTLLGDRFARVIAIDASAPQLAEASPHARVEYRVARAEDTGLDDATVDLLTVAQAAHWFDVDAFHREARRIVRPGGAVAWISYGVVELDGPAAEVLRAIRAEVASFWPPERRHVESGYRTLDFRFDELDAPPLAIRLPWTADDFANYVETWSATKRAADERGAEIVARFRRDIREAWGDPAQRRDVTWPLVVRAGRV